MFEYDGNEIVYVNDGIIGRIKFYINGCEEASNETVGTYAAVFGLSASDLLITVEAYENRSRGESLSKQTQLLMGVIFVGGFVSGICLTLWFI